MKIKIWVRIQDLGDGSSASTNFKSREEAYEGFDEDGFCLICPGAPIEVEETIFDTAGFEVVG